jgi:RimJ/RimL family protein N-acetyltransferase
MRIYETERLCVREMTEGDLPALAAILQDPVCMSAYEGPFSDAETRDWLNLQMERYREYGYGLWAVVLKPHDDMIGQCGLSWQEFGGRQILEIDCLLQRKHWHNGYATEATRGCKQYAFETLEATEVFSRVRNTNIASMNVAIRNGMTIRGSFVKRCRNVDMTHYAFSVRKLELSQEIKLENASDAPAKSPPQIDFALPHRIGEDENRTQKTLSGIIAKFSPPEEKIALFMSLFDGRRDVYALRRYSKRFESAYYMPACRHERASRIRPYRHARPQRRIASAALHAVRADPIQGEC